MTRFVAIPTALALVLLLAGPTVAATEDPRLVQLTLSVEEQRLLIADALRVANHEDDDNHGHGNAKGHDKKRRVRGGGSSGIARGDFNGDGFADLAVGVPGKRFSSTTQNAGAVVVIYGSANGLVAPTTTGAIPKAQFWSQSSSGIPGSPEAGDLFGFALAAGDFNGDGASDLAIGVPGEDVNFNGTTFTNVGAVVVIYGSKPDGLKAGTGAVRDAQFWSLATGRSDKLKNNVQLGMALAWGDFDGDGHGDLAIGAPGFTTFPIFGQSAGAVWILYGSSTGLDTVGNQFFTQDDIGLSSSGNSDSFGASLAAGDFTGDGVSELVIGMPFKGVSTGLFTGFSECGQVIILPGIKHTGLTTSNAQIRQADVGPSPFVGLENNLHFGASFAVGDFDGDGLMDLAVGAPGMTINGKSRAGGIFIFRGTKSGNVVSILLADGTQFFSLDDIRTANPNTSARSETGDEFGLALAAGDFDGDGHADLAIGAPFKTVVSGGASFAEAGEVIVLYGSSTGLSATGHAPQKFNLATTGVTGTPATGDHFGLSLTAWNFGRDEIRHIGTPPITFDIVVKATDLAIGAPDKTVGGVVGAGAVSVIYGSVLGGGLVTTDSQIWAEGQPGIPTTAGTGDGFGIAIY